MFTLIFHFLTAHLPYFFLRAGVSTAIRTLLDSFDHLPNNAPSHVRVEAVLTSDSSGWRAEAHGAHGSVTAASHSCLLQEEVSKGISVISAPLFGDVDERGIRRVAVLKGSGLVSRMDGCHRKHVCQIQRVRVNTRMNSCLSMDRSPGQNSTRVQALGATRGRK